MRKEINMKLKMQRLSGEVMDLPAYMTEFALAYDEILAKHLPGVSAENRNAAFAGLNEAEKVAVSDELTAVETVIRAKHGLFKEVTLPSNRANWLKLINTEGPIMVAQSSANPEELVLIVIDMPIGHN